jgi:hypothetical protein
MPKIMAQYEFKRTRTSKRYDWDTLLDGKVYLVGPDDFEGAKITSFESNARAAAANRDKGLRVSRTDESGTPNKEGTFLVLQAFPKPPKAETNGHVEAEASATATATPEAPKPAPVATPGPTSAPPSKPVATPKPAQPKGKK